MKSPARLDPTDSIYFPSSSTKQPRGRLCANPILKFIIFQNFRIESRGVSHFPKKQEVFYLIMKLKLKSNNLHTKSSAKYKKKTVKEYIRKKNKQK